MPRIFKWAPERIPMHMTSEGPIDRYCDSGHIVSPMFCSLRTSYMKYGKSTMQKEVAENRPKLNYLSLVMPMNNRRKFNFGATFFLSFFFFFFFFFKFNMDIYKRILSILLYQWKRKFETVPSRLHIGYSWTTDTFLAEKPTKNSNSGWYSMQKVAFFRTNVTAVFRFDCY